MNARRKSVYKTYNLEEVKDEVIDLIKDLNQDNEHCVIEDDEDIIEFISNSTNQSYDLPFLQSIGDPDSILNVGELLKETIINENGKHLPIFSNGPWPKVKKYENQLRPINCHICRFTTVKRDDMKNHISRQRHIRRIKNHFVDEKYNKPMRNFYDFNENKTTILFAIRPGENIKEVAKYHSDRLIEYKKEDISNTCVQPAKSDKLYDMNEENPILGLEYCIKLTRSNENDEYYCVLCDKLFDDINNVQHFIDYAHQQQYIEKHFAELREYCLNTLHNSINDKIYCNKKTHEVLIDIYRKIEIQSGFRHIYTIKKNLFHCFQNEYNEKINKLSHYSLSPNELSTNDVMNKMIYNFIQRSVYMQPQCERKSNTSVIKNCTEDIKPKELQILGNNSNKVTLKKQIDTISNKELSNNNEELTMDEEERFKAISNQQTDGKSNEELTKDIGETNEKEELTKDNEVLAMDNEELIKDNEEITKTIEETKETQELTMNDDELTKETEELTNGNEVLAMDNEELTKTMEETQDEKELTMDIEEIKNIEELPLDDEELTKDKEELTKGNEVLTMDIEKLTKDKGELTKSTEVLAMDIVELTKDNEELTKDNEELTMDDEEIFKIISNQQMDAKSNEELTTDIGETNKKEELTKDNEELIKGNAEIPKNIEETKDKQELIMNDEEFTMDNEELLKNNEKLTMNNEKTTTTELIMYNEEILKDNNELIKDIEELAAEKLIQPVDIFEEESITEPTNKIISQCKSKKEEIEIMIQPTTKNEYNTEENIKFTSHKKSGIIGSNNEFELIASQNKPETSKKPVVILWEESIETIEDEKLGNSIKKPNEKTKESKINIENIIILKKSNVINDKKIVDEVKNNSNYNVVNNTNDFHDIATEKVSITEIVDISMNSNEINNINNIIEESNIIDSLENISANNNINGDFNSLNSSNTECTANLIKETQVLIENKIIDTEKTNIFSNLNSVNTNFGINEIKSCNNKTETSTISNDLCNDKEKMMKNIKNTNSNRNYNNVSAKDNLLEIFKLHTIVKENKEIPILSYGPPTDKLFVRLLRCHICQTNMSPIIRIITEHINGKKHKTNKKKGLFKNPIRCYYKTLDKNTKVFIDIYAGEYIQDETQLKEKTLYYKHAKPNILNMTVVSNKKTTKYGNKVFIEKVESMDTSENKRQLKIITTKTMDSHKKIYEEFPLEIIKDFLKLQIPFKNNHLLSIFSFGPRISKDSRRTVNCHLCEYTTKKLSDITSHIKSKYHQLQKNTIKWINLKKPMLLFYKCENKQTKYFEIWPGENIFKVNTNTKRIINVNQILTEDIEDDKIYEKVNQTIMGLEYGIKLKQNDEICYCFCLLCKEYLLLGNCEYFNHFNGEKHQHNYINKHFPLYKKQIYNTIPKHINDSNIINNIVINSNLDIYKKMEQNFGYRKMYMASLKYFQQCYIYFTFEFVETKLTHYNDKMNLLLENDILDIIEDIIKPFFIEQSTLKRRQNDLLPEEAAPKRVKCDIVESNLTSDSNQSSNGNIQKSNITLISVLRLLSILEDVLGSRLGGQVLEVLGIAALCEKNEQNILKLTTNNNIYMLLITINEKLKGLLEAQLIDSQKLPLVKKLLIEIPIIIDMMDEDKRNLNYQTVSSTSNDQYMNLGQNWFNSFGNNNNINRFENLGLDFNIGTVPALRQINDDTNQYNSVPNYNTYCESAGESNQRMGILKTRINELLRKPEK